MNTKKLRLSDIIIYTVLFIGAAMMLFPFLWMVLSTFKTPQEILQRPPTFFPKIFTLENYPRVWEKVKFSIFFKNSIKLSFTIVAIQLYTSSLIGYVLAKFKFRGNKLIFTLILGSMMIPSTVTLIPMYQLMVTFGWIGSYTSIILPACLTTFGIFLIRQFAISIPNDLLEASRIDGAGEFKIFHKIIIPVLKPPLSALFILQFLSEWDSFLWPYLMLNDARKFTLPIGLSLFNGQWYVDYSSVMTGACISIMPIIIIYIFFQKQFINGIAFNGLKG